jgi:hypothetical protein
VGPTADRRGHQGRVAQSAKLPELEAGYRAMASDTDQEREAVEWIEAMIGDVAYEPVD